METKQIAQELKRLLIALNKAIQFKKKIELNQKIKRFEKQYKIAIENIGNELWYYYYNGEKILKVNNKYATRRVNLEYKYLGKRFEVLI